MAPHKFASLVIGIMAAVWSGQANAQVRLSEEEAILDGIDKATLLSLRVGGRTAPAPVSFSLRLGKANASENRERGFVFTPVIHQWPGIYAEARFKGSHLYAAFDDAVNQYRLWIDDQEQPLLSKPGKTVLKYDHLGDGEHRVRLEKISESQKAVGAFRGFFVPEADAALPPPPRRIRQIEFIGDSDMVAYGANSTRRDGCTDEEIWATTDTSRGYVTRVAKHYDADYQVNAYSGLGVVRNWNGEKRDLNLSTLYPRTLFEDVTPWKRDGWSPQVIIIAIGGNDFSTDLHSAEKWRDKAALRADWTDKFVRFVTDIRAQNPMAHIVLGTYSAYDADYLAANDAAFDRLSARDKRLSRILYPKTENTACNYHHSQNDYALLSRLVIAHLDGLADVWAQGEP
ncbi:GDSL-type esterase/lipase family protein [Asticcacaulis sp. AND118]|uniref:GDSL-type esterase/lipase family protein n=1 Tax=Asticcacaulis sp. AND118 TaxID=2840468 RepID=UPI001CFFE5E7|nr:GDSL-type esterase/lipase family protein [Asticcacaulis sp. AND118]UDF04873.1 GDSL-type esterase/lipase family protein [Asticcacaulis sp. AND118]